MYTQSRNKDLIIIGAGAAGLMAGFFAKNQGVGSICLLEKNEKAGKKIYITGKGRCNICNLSSNENIMKNIVCNSKFMYSSLSLLSPDDIRALLLSLGCETKLERGNRVFPVSDKASDVTNALLRGLKGSEILYRHEVKELELMPDGMFSIGCSNGASFCARAVIIATGGLSYPSTGSSGDGYRFARLFKHSVTPCFPSLTPIELKNEWIPSLEGLSLKNVELRLFEGKKQLWSGFGEMLFTRKGISGPIVLSLSSYLADKNLKSYTLKLDMKPALDSETLEKRLLNEFKLNNRKLLKSILPSLLPRAMADIFDEISNIDLNVSCSQINSELRKSLIEAIKGIDLSLLALAPFREAVITRGGISVNEISPKTMMSKLVKGLFFAGEVIDVDALTGGYNLQIAFSSGASAGRYAGEYIMNEEYK